jgi:hypothetical protein
VPVAQNGRFGKVEVGLIVERPVNPLSLSDCSVNRVSNAERNVETREDAKSAKVDP